MTYSITLYFEDGSSYDKTTYTFETSKNQIKSEYIGRLHIDNNGEYRKVKDALVKDTWISSNSTPELCWN